jgi:hypothetical protein
MLAHHGLSNRPMILVLSSFSMIELQLVRSVGESCIGLLRLGVVFGEISVVPLSGDVGLRSC